MLGIVIPAHNEQRVIEASVRAARAAALHPRLQGESVELVVVLDICTDATVVVAARAGAHTVSVRVRNVGVARAVGAEACGARWLAFSLGAARFETTRASAACRSWRHRSMRFAQYDSARSS
jgi:glycosyltransferase involved in cell wall biosynthesis